MGVYGELVLRRGELLPDLGGLRRRRGGNWGIAVRFEWKRVTGKRKGGNCFPFRVDPSDGEEERGELLHDLDGFEGGNSCPNWVASSDGEEKRGKLLSSSLSVTKLVG